LNEVNLLGKKEKTTPSSTPGFDSVGQILKYYRELKGLSLEEVSKRTYIKLKYLNSLEENLQDVMPAPVYVYSYIKHYAKLLGLEGGELVKLYQKQCNINDGSLSYDIDEDEVKDKAEIKIQRAPEPSGINNENIYLQNKNIIELNSKDINDMPSVKNNGKTLMDLDSIFDNNMIDKPVKTEAKPVIPAIKQEVPATPKIENEILRPEDRMISHEIINATVESERIIREAKKEAERIIKDAQEEAYELRHGAQSYADNVLKSIEHDLSITLNEIRNGRAFLMNKNL
jgi:transcriptional regulator with XRE-family HTH domain